MGKNASDARTLNEIFLTNSGRTVHKWEHYIPIYESELWRFLEVGTPVRLLEIGVQNGGSLDIWAEYLPTGSSIVGVDIDPACATLRFCGDVTVMIVDAADPAALDRVLADRTFDVIIDDGSHRSPDIIATFGACFRRLEPGGLYMIEDLHASYWRSHHGGFRMPGAAIEWLKNLVDALNSDHFEDQDHHISDDLTGLRGLNREIGRIAFFDSVAVIERLREPKDAPWRPIVSGELAEVEAAMRPNIGTLDPPPAPQRFFPFSAALDSKRVAAARHADDVLDLTLQLESLTSRLAQAEARAHAERLRADELEASALARAARWLRRSLGAFRRHDPPQG